LFFSFNRSASGLFETNGNTIVVCVQADFITFFGDDVFECCRSDRSAYRLFERQQKVLYENYWA
jgi:hypothetical protein